MNKRVIARLSLIGAAALTCSSTAAAQAAGSPEAKAAARTDPTWAPPRTPWGHPDLQGIWTTDDMRGIPQQRAPEFGTRQHLTDEEYAQREEQRERARQTQDRGASGTFRNEEGTRSFSYTSLVIDPPDGRIPPVLAAATRAALDARLVRPRTVQQRGRLQSLRSLHHARRDRLVLTGRLRQRCAHRANAGHRGHLLRNGPRHADHSSRRPPRPEREHSPVHGRRARPLRRQHARHRDHELHGQDARSAVCATASNCD